MSWDYIIISYAYLADRTSRHISLQCLDPEAEEAGREWMIASLPDNRARNRFKNITPCTLPSIM